VGVNIGADKVVELGWRSSMVTGATKWGGFGWWWIFRRPTGFRWGGFGWWSTCIGAEDRWRLG